MALTLVFLAAVVVGFKRNLWIIVVALAGHAAFDFIHAGLVNNPGVPAWWPMFCLSYDLTAAAWLAWQLLGGSRPAGQTARLAQG